MRYYLSLFLSVFLSHSISPSLSLFLSLSLSLSVSLSISLPLSLSLSLFLSSQSTSSLSHFLNHDILYPMSIISFVSGVLDGSGEGPAHPASAVSLSESELLIMLEIISKEASGAVDEVCLCL